MGRVQAMARAGGRAGAGADRSPAPCHPRPGVRRPGRGGGCVRWVACGLCVAQGPAVQQTGRKRARAGSRRERERGERWVRGDGPRRPAGRAGTRHRRPAWPACWRRPATRAASASSTRCRRPAGAAGGAAGPACARLPSAAGGVPGRSARCPLLGLAPPGRPATLTGVAICRFASGRLEDLWLQADLLGLLEQLDVLPPLGLTQAAAAARVRRAGALLAGEAQPAPHRTPP